MSPRYIRVPPERHHDVAAGLLSGAIAAGVGLAAFYLLRLMLSREPLQGGSRGLREAPRPEE